MRQRLLQRLAQWQRLHQLLKQLLQLLKLPNPLKLVSLLGLKVYLVQVNLQLLHLYVQ